jgi:glycosidase
MNYIFRNAVLAYANGGSAKALVANLELMREAYPPQAHSALMNLLSTHDAARALHQFGYHDDTQDAAVIARAKQRLLLAVFLQMAYPGAPTIYYGDEVGVTGGEDPYNRGTYPWADEGGRPDLALLAAFKRLTKMRHDNPVLRRGELLAPLFVDEQVVILARVHDGRRALVAISNDAAARKVDVTLPAGWRDVAFTDALEGTRVASRGTVITVTVPATFGVALIESH